MLRTVSSTVCLLPSIALLESAFSPPARTSAPSLMAKDPSKSPASSALSKNEYISRLERNFKRDKKNLIHVTFDEIKVVRHPSDLPEYNRTYGVTLHQTYKSEGYNDEGYVFLLWDFMDEEKPKIHVRTWQPDAYSKDGKTRTRLSDDEIFSIADFEDYKENKGKK